MEGLPDSIIQHKCLEGMGCELRNVIFQPSWTEPWCPGRVEGKKRMCFACSAFWNDAGSLECAKLSAPGKGDEYGEHQMERKATWAKIADDQPPLGVLENGREDGGRLGVLAIDGSPGECQTFVKGFGILTYVDGWNPYHQVLQTLRKVFEAIIQFDERGEMAVHAGAGDVPYRHPAGSPKAFDCTIVVKDDAMLNDLGPFGRPILQKLCRYPPIALHSAKGPVCFERLVLGATPGGWDMEVDKRVVQPIRYSSLIMGICLRNLFDAPARAAWGKRGKGMQVLFVQRRGRRVMENYDDTMRELVSVTRPRGIKVVPADFDGMTLLETINNVSMTHVLTGVHGAGLTNMIFLPLPAACVEVSIGYLRPEFHQLAQSLRVKHYDFDEIILVGPYNDPDPREMNVYVVRKDWLAEKILRAVDDVRKDEFGPFLAKPGTMSTQYPHMFSQVEAE